MRTTLLLISAAAGALQPAQAQTFRSLLFHPGQDTAVGPYELRLEGPNNPDAPSLWEGPLRITKGVKSCEARVSLVNAVWAAPAAKFAVVVSQSGSNTLVQFIDVASCAEKWPKIKAFTEEVRVLPYRIRFLPACECGSADVPCSCTAGQVYRFGYGRAPGLLAAESRELTREQLGVEFTGTHKVMHPRTPQARVMPN